MSRNPLGDLSQGLGDYLREQRESARLSVRQLSDLAGISNPYLSQIERGLKRPSAEILGRLAKGLEVSAESLYVRAGLLESDTAASAGDTDTRRAITADPWLTDRQKSTLLDIYDSFVGDDPRTAARESAGSTRVAAGQTKASQTKSGQTKASQTKAGKTTTKTNQSRTSRTTPARPE